ncbi:hypothetical protein [Paenibacillus sp. RUD330]|uniref:hypothetical protein n=1 Tax=Paenibacillus sp. RUD330 TaxID=2023772 RepID=UPI000B92C745|nr:hypothetical protein [Paenibacillus sp. RUD330]ASS66542.1 hypothetical protein CIC07_10515 [Paenibacillus sp. RUD330]
MSRPSLKVYNKQTVTHIPTRVHHETFTIIYENKDTQTVDVTVGFFDENEVNVGGKRYVITGNYYALLMAANPPYSPNKQKNEYREADLFYIIDLMDSEEEQGQIIPQ